MSPDVWPDLPAAPGGLTASRGAVHGASPKSCPKDALPDSKLSKPSPPRVSHDLGHTEASKVSDTVQEGLTPAPQKAAPQGQSQSEPLKEKKDPVGEKWESLTLHPSPSLSPSFIVSPSINVGPEFSWVRLPYWVSVCVTVCGFGYNTSLPGLNDASMVRGLGFKSPDDTQAWRGSEMRGREDTSRGPCMAPRNAMRSVRQD